MLRFSVAGCVGALAVCIQPTFAQLIPDNSLGQERSQIIPINQNNDRIEGGASRGTNLFHSFQDFNVGDGRGVYFANPQGITNINAPDTTSIQNSFTELSPNVIETNALIANSCIVRSPKQKGTFFITGSGGLRNSPGDGLISNYSTSEVRNVEPTSRTWKKGDAIVEPQGLYRLANGGLVLSRECE
ncbi:MAG: hypothetical protein HWQ39_11190 [Nostoc sp. NMS8]|nr:hypothetical protein [Nostoc sp. NMS8]